jgi:hypothetical protein
MYRFHLPQKNKQDRVLRVNLHKFFGLHLTSGDKLFYNLMILGLPHERDETMHNRKSWGDFVLSVIQAMTPQPYCTSGMFGSLEPTIRISKDSITGFDFTKAESARHGRFQVNVCLTTHDFHNFNEETPETVKVLFVPNKPQRKPKKTPAALWNPLDAHEIRMMSGTVLTFPLEVFDTYDIVVGAEKSGRSRASKPVKYHTMAIISVHQVPFEF